MPISPRSLFDSAGLKLAGSTQWGKAVSVGESGVYAISLHPDPSAASPGLANAPICPSKVGAWLGRVPSLSLDGKSGPSVAALAGCLQTFWLPDEPIVYIGMAKSLKKRLGDFRRHVLGGKKPHAGGHWIKALTVLDNLWFHYAICPSPKVAKDVEGQLITQFCGQVTASTRARLPAGMTPIPFANREFPKGISKQQRIRKSTLEGP